MNTIKLPFLALTALLIASPAHVAQASPPEPLPATAPLTLQGDIASHLVDGVDRFLSRTLRASKTVRTDRWQALAAAANRTDLLAQRRAHLRHILGVVDPRIEFDDLELIATPNQDPPGALASAETFDALAVRWPVLDGVYGSGLLLKQKNPRPNQPLIIAIPDAGQTPEQISGLAPGVPPASQFARHLAQSGCDVLVLSLVGRHLEKRNQRALLTDREFLYRPAFILGRHIIGYELQKLFALVDWAARARPSSNIGLIGWGEGGLLALHAAALDDRISAAAVSGYFTDRTGVWQEPIDRNVFDLLTWFGDAELAAMIVPRTLLIEAARAPELTLPSEGGAPGKLATPPLAAVRAEAERARDLAERLGEDQDKIQLVISDQGTGPYATEELLQSLLISLGIQEPVISASREPLPARMEVPDRRSSQVHEIERHTQQLLVESSYVRAAFMSKLDTTSLETFQQSIEPYREFFATNVIGRFEDPLSPPHPRSRLAYQGEGWRGFEIVLDVFPDVIAYGILLLPDDLRDGEQRPVVVCQHGLEGRPQQLIQGDHPAYHDYAAKLCQLGYIVFAPQNLYLFHDRFRVLQRKANPLGKTLFSIITPQHRQILNWLKTLPAVDPDRIAFYGLSYGGKTAMRVPALLEDYCLSICSADFNDWVWKNASTRSPYSYVWTGEYEIFEFNLGGTFNYAEMAALIAPRPFMVERGHFDGVAPDERVAYEFAKVRHLYQAKLGLGDRATIEWFPGPHTINAQGTFEFLKEHLALEGKHQSPGREIRNPKH